MDKGWGACGQGTCAKAQWSEEVRQTLEEETVSIPPLKLIAAAAAVHIAAEWGKVPEGRRFVIRYGNKAACAAAKNWTACTNQMLATLEVWREVTRGVRVQVRLTYIASENNEWADTLTRNRNLLAEVRRVWSDETRVPPPAGFEQWVLRVCTKMSGKGREKELEDSWRIEILFAMGFY